LSVESLSLPLVLVVEDEAALRETLAYNLEHAGYRVLTAADGRQGLALARREHPDLLVLDLMLPGLDGLEVTRRLRQEGDDVLILMLTARADEVDRVLGLEFGADDYLTKPFSMRELLARVKALLRRARLRREVPPAAPRCLQSGDLCIDLDRREIQVGEQRFAPRPKEFDLLVFFARHRGQTLTREQLLREVWGWDFHGGSRTVDVHVRWLREKIEADPSHPTRLVTVRGVGYRFEG